MAIGGSREVNIVVWARNLTDVLNIKFWYVGLMPNVLFEAPALCWSKEGLIVQFVEINS